MWDSNPRNTKYQILSLTPLTTRETVHDVSLRSQYPENGFSQPLRNRFATASQPLRNRFAKAKTFILLRSTP